ncbi:hypothetical protein RYZ27_07010 [Hyphomonas sp. FCG-A18]|uniref:hypothetical protein n=1 Tax=Hyphomonas sp. FCG-A18 TaxID=3080019 RepID=UPI002B2B5CF8|nr:hypothetical protein RYZ27_07010 [Hyphomonas sp. FCG-A18]
MTDMKDAIEQWCQSYTAAFSNYDAVGIGAHWMFPAVILSGGRSLTFRDAEHFNKNTANLLSFYKAQDVAAARRRLIEYLELDAGAVSIKVADDMISSNGETIVSWTASYVLNKGSEGLRAVMAIADGELKAWAARGTPLGAK